MLKRLFGGKPRAADAGEDHAAPLPTPVSLDPSRCLFIIGAARTGTTILQNALNHARDIFLLGEPRFDADGATPGFAARYNAAHRSWSNQETKSTFCPLLTDEDGGWRDHLERLGREYRWVGAKTVVADDRRGPGGVEDVFAFHSRHFYTSRYLLTFRSPRAAIASTRELQAYRGDPPQAFARLVAYHADTVGLFTRMLRNLPHVRGIIHEDVDARVLEEIGRWLGVPLDGAAAYYDTSRVRAYTADGLSDAERALLERLETLHADLRAGIRDGFDRPQLEQNDANILPTHYTALGSLARRAGMIGDDARKAVGE